MAGSARRRRWWALVGGIALLSACGSTVPPSQRLGGGAGNEAALRGGSRATDANGDGIADATQAGSGSAELGGGATAGRNGGVGSSVASPGAALSGAAAGGGRASSVALGPGVTADKIYVGLSYTVNSSAANTAIGAAGITQGDPKAEDEALIADINSHGGIAGHKVEGVFHEVDGNSSAPWDVTDQQTCEDWTTDHKIFVALAEPIADSDTMVGCLDKRGVGLVNTGLSTSDGTRFKRFPAYIELVMMNLDRAAAAEVAALKAQGWFSGWNPAAGAPAPTPAKVGIVTYEGATWAHAVDQVMVPALRAAGFAPAPGDIVRVPQERATSDAGGTGAAASSAVLKLRGDGVTHVIVFDRKALLTLFFARAADSQNYRPRYGLNSQNGVEALLDGATLPAQQLIGSMGIGWFPGLDISPAENTPSGPYSNEPRRKCLALMKSKNIELADANAEAIALNSCGSWWFLRDALNASGVLNRAGFLDGVARLGSSFLTPSNFANRFSATQHDGVGAFRNYAYDQGCSCMHYTSGNISAP